MISSFFTSPLSKLAALLNRQQRASFRRPLVLFAGIPVLFLSFLTPLSPATAATPASGYWTVAAGGQRSVVFATTVLNTPTLENGSYFYFTANKSIGFAPNSTINQNGADVENRIPCDAGNGDLRLSWHLEGSGGWRAGCSISLNTSPEPRAVYQSSSSSSLFTGAAKNVSHQTLLDNGWSLCWDDTYAFALATDGSDLTSACTQTYVLLAGGGTEVPSSPAEAEVEVEAGPPGVPGIFLAVNDVLVGSQVTGAPIYCGADSIQPNSIYTLSIQSVTNSALTRIILDSGSVNSRGHLDERVLLPEMNPGSYNIVMTGIHASGNLLVLTNFITIGANSGIVSVSPESQQPFLK